jgi:hypothetical protein
MAQMQAVLTRADKAPDLYNRQAVEQRLLKQLKIPGINELLKDTPAPEERTPADENVAMALGQNAFAYIHQDHLAHIQSHLDFALNPIYGSNPIMASFSLPRTLEHIKQHMVMWYLNRMNGYVSKTRGDKQLTEEEYENKQLTAEIDKVFALASQHVKLDSEKAFSQIVPLVQQLMQSMQQLAPKPQLPPEAMVLRETSMAETERRAKKDAGDLQLKTQQMQQDAAEAERKEQLDIALNSVDNLTKERIETARLTQKDQELQTEQFETAIRLQQEVQRKLGDPNGY